MASQSCCLYGSSSSSTRLGLKYQTKVVYGLLDGTLQYEMSSSLYTGAKKLFFSFELFNLLGGITSEADDQRRARNI